MDEQMNRNDARIRKLEAENEQLRRANTAVRIEKDNILEAYKHLIKQIKEKEQTTPCRVCQQRFSLTTISLSPELVPAYSDGSSALAPLSDPLTTRDTQFALCPKPRTSSNRHPGDRIVQSPLAHRTAQVVLGESVHGNVLAEISPRHNGIGRGRRSSSPVSSDISMHSSSRLAEENDIAADPEPDEQSSASSSDSSSVMTDEDHDDGSATSIEARMDIESVGAGREGSETPNAQQRGNLRRSSISRNNRGISDKVPLTLHQRKEPARGSNPPQGLPVTKSPGAKLNNAKPSTKTNTVTGRAGPRKASSNSRLNRAGEMSSASRSLESRVSYHATAVGIQDSTTVDSSPRIRPNPVTPTVSRPAAARSRCDEPADRGQEEPDADLKAAIRESYARFGLDDQRLTFCCEPLTLDPTAINLNTNWKQRSKLNRSLVERLLQMGAEISAFLPESDMERATQKETELMRRLCTCKRPMTASRSLKEVVRSLRRERDVTKDELNLIEFDLYSTLIVMRCQSENQAGPPFPEFNDMIDKIGQSSSRKRSRRLVIINAAFSGCTRVCTCSLQV